METLQNIMTTPVITVEPHKSVSYALKLMEHHKISCLVVIKDKKPLGIFTERKLIQVRVKNEIDHSLPIDRFMTLPPLTASADMNYQDAYKLLLHNRFRHLVVTDHDDNMVGVITNTDFLSNLGLEFFMEFKNVAQVMSRDVITLKSSSSVFAAMKLMNNRRISSLVIDENRIPKGIITERDIVRLVRSNVNLEKTQLHEVMSHPVRTIFSDISNHDAAMIFMKEGLRRLVVTNSKGEYAGIITETDMVKGLTTSYTDHLKEIIEHQAKELRGVQKQMEENLYFQLSCQTGRCMS